MISLNDDDDFVPTVASTSHLANLFGNNNSTTVSEEAGNPLIYTPQKQPREQNLDLQQQSQPKKLVCVKTIQLHRLFNGTYTLVGKFGAAIICSPDGATNELIIYRTKQQIISTSKIGKEWLFRCANNIVIQFKDDQNEFWSLTFENLKDMMEFAGELSKLGAVMNEEGKQQQLVAEKPEEDDLKANILGRISKVGLSILPTANKEPSLSVSESETEEINSNKFPKKPHPRRNSNKNRYQSVDPTDSEIDSDAMDLIPNYSGGGAVPHNRFMQVTTMPHPLMDPLNVYFAENRTHNSEVRMNLTQLMNKIDSLSRDLQVKSSNSDVNERLALLENTVMRNKEGQERQPQNNNLQQMKSAHEDNCKKYEAVIEEQTERIRQLEEDLKNALLENHQQKESIKMHEDTMEKHKLDLNNLEAKYKELVAINDSEKLMHNELEAKITLLMEQLQEQKIKSENLLSEKNELAEQNRNLSVELQMKAENVKIMEDKQISEMSESVKESMNKMYQSVLSKCDVAKDIKRAMQHSMKAATFEIIQLLSNVNNSGSQGTQGRKSTPSTPVPEFEVTV